MSAYHPDDFTLLEYSAGSLGAAQALAVSVHLSYCRHCQEQLKKLNALGGALLSEATPASVGVDGSLPEDQADDDDGFEALMARIESAPERQETEKPAPSAGFHNPLERYLPKDLENLEWQQQTREIAKFDLDKIIKVDGARIALQRIKAGAKVPTHTHKGSELTVVLKGSFSDELGVYSEGDFIARDASHHHSPRAMQNEDCICLTILDAPMRFTGPLMRLLNPFMAWKT